MLSFPDISIQPSLDTPIQASPNLSIQTSANIFSHYHSIRLSQYTDSFICSAPSSRCGWGNLKFINYFFFGVVLGGLFFLTELASVLNLIRTTWLAVPLGILSGLASGMTNGTLASKAMRPIFSKQFELWLILPVVFSLIGGLNSLPFVAAVLQATGEIRQKIGINIEFLNPVLGNSALFTFGILLSMGIVRFLSNIITYCRWKLFKHQKSKWIQMRCYLYDQRSTVEYRAFQENPENFFKEKLTRCNLLALALSPIVLIGLYGIASEIPKALSYEHDLALIKVLNMFGLIPLDQYAKTSLGSKVICCSVGGPLYSLFVATTFRTLSRDMVFLYRSLYQRKITQASEVFLYLLFIFSTALTPIFEAIEGGDNSLLVILTFISTFLVNYAGPRTLFFTLILPLFSRLSHCCRRKPRKREETKSQLFFRLSATATDHLLLPAVSESIEKCKSLQVLNRLQEEHRLSS